MRDAYRRPRWHLSGRTQSRFIAIVLPSSFCRAHKSSFFEPLSHFSSTQRAHNMGACTGSTKTGQGTEPLPDPSGLGHGALTQLRWKGRTMLYVCLIYLCLSVIISSGGRGCSRTSYLLFVASLQHTGGTAPFQQGGMALRQVISCVRTGGAHVTHKVGHEQPIVMCRACFALCLTPARIASMMILVTSTAATTEGGVSSLHQCA